MSATVTQAPERSMVQRMDALERANDIRIRRSALKRDLKSGRESAEHLLLAPPDFIGTMKLHELLMALPKFGRVKVNKILNRCKVSPSKTVGGLSERQRREVAMWLGRHSS